MATTTRITPLPASSGSRALVRSLWRNDPRRSHLTKPNWRPMLLMLCLTVVSIVTLVTYLVLLPILITDKMVMDRLSQRDLGGIEERVETPDELAAEIRKIGLEHAKFEKVAYQLAKLQEERETVSASLARFKKSNGELEKEVKTLRADLAEARGEMAAKEPLVRERLRKLALMVSLSNQTFRHVAEFLSGTTGSPAAWKEQVKRVEKILRALIEVAELSSGKERAEWSQVAERWARLTARHRAQDLREHYLHRVYTEVLGPKFMKAVHGAAESFDKEFGVLVLPEILGPVAGLPQDDLLFPAGDIDSDSLPLDKNWRLFRPVIAGKQGTAAAAFAREFASKALQVAAGEGRDTNEMEPWIKENLNRLRAVSDLHVNAIPSLLGDEKTEQAHQVFLKGLNKALDGQQPYLTWSLAKFGQRLLGEAALQPPVLSNQKIWKQKVALEQPYVFTQTPKRFKLLDYKRTVCDIYPNVLSYPASASGFSCSTTKVYETNKTRRHATIEMEPGTYYIQYDAKSPDEFLVNLKGRYALEKAALLAAGSPFAFFVEIPYEEESGYWVTPIRGAVHIFDNQARKPKAKALAVIPEDETSWRKYNAISGAPGAWRSLQVTVGQRFLRGLAGK